MILKTGSGRWAAQVAVGQGRAGGEQWAQQALHGQGTNHQLLSLGEAANIYLWGGKKCIPNTEAEI